MKCQQGTLPVRRRRDFHAQEKNWAVRKPIVKLQAHTEKGTYPRDLHSVAKANITPDEEFKTELHSIKKEAKLKFIGALTKFQYRHVERNNDKLRGAKSDKSRSKKTLIGLSITPCAQSNSSVLHSSTTWVEKVHRWHTLAAKCWQKGEEFIVLANSHHPTIKFTAEISDKEISNFLDTTVFKGERFNKQAILDIHTHFKPTETFQYTHFPSYHSPGVRKGLAKGLSAKSVVENITQFKTRLAVRETTPPV